MTKKIITIIPARGGSKSIPRKNIKELAGKPLIAYSIEAARQVKDVARVIVSTDDEEIAAVARHYGAEVPFIRPAELAGDDVPTLPVLQHALEYLAQMEQYIPDYVLLIYPTSPLLTPQRMQEAIDFALQNDAASVVSGYYDRHHYWIKGQAGWQRLHPQNVELQNRQLAQPLFKENGALYLNKTAVLAKCLVAEPAAVLIMEPAETIDIDEPADFDRVAAIMRARVK